MKKRNSNRRKASRRRKTNNNNRETVCKDHQANNQKSENEKNKIPQKNRIITFIIRNGLLALVITILLKIGVWIVVQKHDYDLKITVLENNYNHLAEQVNELAHAYETLRSAIGTTAIYYVTDYDPNINQAAWTEDAIVGQPSLVIPDAKNNSVSP